MQSARFLNPRLIILLTLIGSVFNQLIAQDTLQIRMSKDSIEINTGEKLLFIYDGIPIGDSKEIMNYINVATLDSIFQLKRPVFTCENKLRYDGIMDLRSKDSANPALKHILLETDRWIFRNPLSQLYLNGKYTEWIDGFTILSESDVDLIKQIELEDRRRGDDCHNGRIRLTLN